MPAGDVARQTFRIEHSRNASSSFTETFEGGGVAGFAPFGKGFGVTLTALFSTDEFRSTGMLQRGFGFGELRILQHVLVKLHVLDHARVVFETLAIELDQV